MSKKIINETQFRGLLEECVRRVSQAMKPLNEAVSGGWEVDESEVQEAYNLACRVMGEETTNSAIIRCMGERALAECLAYIFRQYDFKEWSQYKDEKENDGYEDEEEY